MIIGNKIGIPSPIAAGVNPVIIARKNGIKNKDLVYAKSKLNRKYKSRTIEGINFGEVFAEFDWVD